MRKSGSRRTAKAAWVHPSGSKAIALKNGSAGKRTSGPRTHAASAGGNGQLGEAIDESLQAFSEETDPCR